MRGKAFLAMAAIIVLEAAPVSARNDKYLLPIGSALQAKDAPERPTAR